MEYDVDPERIKEAVSRSKQYAMIVLERGQRYDETKDVMPAHATYWIRKKDEGIVLTNGPVLGDTDITGLGIFSTDDLNAVRRLMDGDPRVVSGRFRYRAMLFRGIPGDRLV